MLLFREHSAFKIIYGRKYFTGAINLFVISMLVDSLEEDLDSLVKAMT